MAGWENNKEIYVESVEEILDTNPDLYKQRTIAALNEKRYNDALKEVNLALQYGNGELQYKVLKARVLFEKQDYSGCMRYLRDSQLWDKKEDITLLNDEKNYIYYIYAVCYRECRYSLYQVDMIIVTPDGKGMYDSVYKAILESNGKKIYLTGGKYTESLSVRNQKVNLVGSKYVKSVWEKSMNIEGGIVSIEQVTFETYKEEKPALFIEKAVCNLSNLKFKKSYVKNGVGLGLQLCRSCNVQDIEIENYAMGLVVCEGNTSVQKITLVNNVIGIICADDTGKAKLTCRECKFIGNEVGAVSGMNGDLFIEGSRFEKNHVGIKAIHNQPGMFNNAKGMAGKMLVKMCNIRGSKHVGVIVTEDCEIQILETEIIGGQGICNIKDSFITHNTYESEIHGQGKILKENVKLSDNNIVGSTIEGVKGFIKKYL